jgi:hypothetical protein
MKNTVIPLYLLVILVEMRSCAAKSSNAIPGKAYIIYIIIEICIN